VIKPIKKSPHANGEKFTNLYRAKVKRGKCGSVLGRLKKRKAFPKKFERK
jgi:hypothetical protein